MCAYSSQNFSEPLPETHLFFIWPKQYSHVDNNWTF